MSRWALFLAVIGIGIVAAGFGPGTAEASTLRLTTSVWGPGWVTADWGGFTCSSPNYDPSVEGANCYHAFVNDAPWALTVGAWLTATPRDENHAFTGWSGCDKEQDGKCGVESDCCYQGTDQTVTAQFSRVRWPVTVGIVGGGSGTLTSSDSLINCPGDCSETYIVQPNITLTATAAAGSKVSGWSAGCASQTTTTCTVNSATHINVFIYQNPANDNFANAQAVSLPFTGAATNRGATGEAGEPAHLGFHTGDVESVWYRVNLLQGGILRANGCGRHYLGHATIYSGSSLSGLTRLGGANPNLHTCQNVDVGVASGTYWIAFEGQVDADGDFDISISLLPDTAAPSGTIRINNGARYTRNPAVTLALSATDPAPGSGVTHMRFRNASATTWSAWEPVGPTKSWVLTSANGKKTVYVQYLDGAFNISTSVSDSIFLDSVRPTGGITINGGAASTATRSVTLTLAATDAAPASGVAYMRFRNGSAGTWSRWQPYGTSKAWTLTTGAGTKRVEVQFRDWAANNSLIAYDTIVYSP
jgi:hypothetical protein